MMRESGILMPVSSLPNEFGIGCFSIEAFEFVDFLKASGQGYWQVLPFGPTGFGDSPYQSTSSFAGNPYFVSLEGLIDDGLLTWEECRRFSFGDNQEKVDYGALYENRFKVLRIAYDRFKETAEEDEDYQAFLEKEAYWLGDYTLYMALKQKFEGKSWVDWDEEYRTRDEAALQAAREEYADTIAFYSFIQYEFFRQWTWLHDYAASRDVKIIGDIPFYIAMDSAATWAHSEIFQFDEDMHPTAVAGCAPDAFSKTGQLWGNPLYDWQHCKETGYEWWVQRIARNCEFYDVLRIDHFNGFDSYYAVPYGDETAENGSQEKGPGIDFFNVLKEKLGDIRIIAEDLGTNTPSSVKLLADTGYPGMKVLQYAFDWEENSWYLPYKHIRNCVVYTGTHDNTTVLDWIENASDHDRDYARRYINSINTNYGQFVWDFIREAYRSVADLCIVPLQDYLVKGAEARINSPGTASGNWQWRLAPNFLSRELSQSIYDMAKLYGRLPAKTEPEDEEED